MPSTPELPRPPGPSRAKTDVGPCSQSNRVSKRPQFPSTRRSVPCRILPPVSSPVTPASSFLPIIVELLHPACSIHDLQASLPKPYQAAITRLDELVADSTLAANEKSLLVCALCTAQSFVAVGTVHDLVHTISSPLTPTYELLALVNTIVQGMKAFIAQPGPSSGTSTSGNGSKSSSVTRSVALKDACAARDNKTCVVTGISSLGASCHILPHSVKGDKADNFWALVALFKGPLGMDHLKRMTLGPPPSSTDNIRNMLWLSQDAHTYFDSGKLAIVPVVTGNAAYDPATVTNYTAHIELPYGPQNAQLVVWTTNADGSAHVTPITPGHTITLRTLNPAILPLPHPVLLQLHTALTRLRKMCASAGVPILPDGAPDEDEGEYIHGDITEVDYQDPFGDDNQDIPLFSENTMWPTTSGGLPLKKRYLQLLPGSDESESDQYFQVIKHWASGDLSSSVEGECEGYQVEPIVNRGKRGHQLVDHDDESGSELSRAVTELGGRKRRYEYAWKGSAVVGGSWE